MSVYLKKTGLGTEERKMVRDLGKFLKTKQKADATFELTPARNLSELKQYYIKYCTEEADIISETKDVKKETPPDIDDDESLINESKQEKEEYESERQEYKKNLHQTADIMAEQTTTTSSDPEKEFIDPLVRTNPVIRDYVQDDKMKRPEDKMSESQSNPSGTIAEPSNFDEAFKTTGSQGQKSTQSGQSSFGLGADQKTNTGGPTKPQPKFHEPVNPANPDMAVSARNKKTKRYAKYIVEATAMLVEKGCIWWVTKDINDVKLAEYDLDKSMNLEVLFSMDGETNMTVREFFRMQCQIAEQSYKFTQEEKDELSEALYDVMIERGIAPTPMQHLMIVAVATIGSKGLTAFGQVMQIKMIKTHPLVSPPQQEEQPPVQQASTLTRKGKKADPEPVTVEAEELAPPKPAAKKKKKAEPEIVHEDDRKLDPEKVMNGEQVVVESKPTAPGKRKAQQVTM